MVAGTWFAPVPVLWLAFGDEKPWPVFLAAFLGCASVRRDPAGLCGRLPWFVLVLAVGGPGAPLRGGGDGRTTRATRVRTGRGDVRVRLALGGFRFLTSFSQAGRSVSTPAAAEVGAPMLIQSASLVSYLGITLLGTCGGHRRKLRTRSPAPAVIASRSSR